MPQLLAHRSAVAALAMAATVAGVLPLLAADPTPAMQPVSVRSAVDNGLVRTVKVGLNKSVVVDLPRDARDILVSNPDIADAVIRTPTRIYITGVKAGQSNVIVFDRAGNFLRSRGEDLFARPHGISMGPDGTIFCTDDGDHTMRQCTL